jgi:hypothetical protein
MTLFFYQRRVQRLLRDTRTQIINTRDIIDYINEARQVLAAEAQCIRVLGTLPLVIASNGPYQYQNIVLPGSPSTTGIAGVLNVNTIWYSVGTGQKWVAPRPWPWFSLYGLSNPVLGNTAGPPVEWSQLAQGTFGSFYVSPPPDSNYALNVDCVGYPVSLTTDTTVEAIPQVWQFAVPYYATYLAMLSMETGGSTAEADKMLGRYQSYLGVGRRGSTPFILPSQNPQVPNPTRPNQLAQQAGG